MSSGPPGGGLHLAGGAAAHLPQEGLSRFSAPSSRGRCHLAFLFDLFCLGLMWWDLPGDEGPI